MAFVHGCGREGTLVSKRMPSLAPRFQKKMKAERSKRVLHLTVGRGGGEGEEKDRT